MGGAEVQLHSVLRSAKDGVANFVSQPPYLVSIEKDAEWAPKPEYTSWRREKSLARDWIKPRTVQPVV